LPFAAYVQQQDHVPLTERFAREAGRRQAGLLDIDPQFLAQFADQRGFRPFVVLDLAAGEFPQSRHHFALRALLDKQPAVSIDQCRCNDEQRLRLVHEFRL